MRCNLTMKTALFLTISAALVVARPSPEAEGGYSYTPPSGFGGARFNHQQQTPSWSPDSRARASEVTVEQVPIRLVQQSSEINRQMAFPSAPNRGAYYFPSQRQQQQQQQQFPQQYFRSEHAEQLNRNSFNNQYRQNDAPQQRGAYVFPPAQRGGFTPMFQPQYERPQQARNFRFNNQQGRYQQPDNQYRTLNNNNFYNNNNNNYRYYPVNNNNNNLNFNPSNNFNPTLGNNSPTFINNIPPNNQYQGQNHQNQGQNYPNQGHGNGNNGNGQNYGNNGQNYGNQGNGYTGQNYGNNGQNYGNNQLPGNFPPTSNGNQQQPTPTQGYNYVAPETNGPTMEANLNTTDGAAGNLTDLGPRITIAISKSTVIHTGKGSYKIDEKTGLPQPLIAEAHSYAGLPDPNEKSKTNDSDNLTGEGTGNIPIISRGTPPEDEENPNTVDEESETEANTEEPDTEAPPEEQPTTPAPTAATPQQQQQPLYTNAWPLKSYGGYHAHVVVAPGQTQFFALGTSTPAHQAYYYTPTEYVTPYSVQSTAAGQYYTAQPLYAQQYGAYHPSVLARSSASPFAPYLPYIVQDPAVINGAYGAFSPIYTHDNRQAKALENPEPAPENPAEEVNEPQQEQPETQQQLGRRIIDMGGVAVAGPGGVADAGHGGTAIVGPGGTAYSSPSGVSIVGPGGKVLLQGASSETILAKGPVIYYHKA